MIAVLGNSETFGGSREWAGFEEMKNARTRYYFFSHDYHVCFCSLDISQNFGMGWVYHDTHGPSAIDTTYENRGTTGVYFACAKAPREIKKYQAAQFEKKY